jgi:DNA-directed RNA polymerase specialized sigma24 family protein
LNAADSQIDALLLPYIHAAHEADSERLLATLASEYVEPVIRQVIRSRLRARFDHQGRSSRNPDAEDLYSETLVQLLSRLKQLKASPEDKAIGDLRGYVAVLSYHACYEYLRLKYPQRHNLKNKLRYLLTHRTGLALWENESGDQVGGFSAWREQTKARTRSDRLRQLLDDPPAVLQSAAPHGDFQRANPADLAAAIFNHTNHPIVVALNDGGGQVTIDKEGDVAGAPPPFQQMVKQTLTAQRIETPRMLTELIGKSAVLMGTADEGHPFVLLGPVGTVVMSDRPTFRWRALGGADSYAVKIYDADFNEVAASPQISGTTGAGTAWTVTRALERGRTYSWHVTALVGDKEVVSPVSPAPERGL